MYARCAGLDAHKETVVACVRIAEGGQVSHSMRTFTTTTGEPDGVRRTAGNEPLHARSDGGDWSVLEAGMAGLLADGSFELVLANAAHVKNVPGPRLT
jgi:hypothetical protein